MQNQKVVRLTEEQLRQVIRESVNQILNEYQIGGWFRDRSVHGDKPSDWSELRQMRYQQYFKNKHKADQARQKGKNKKADKFQSKADKYKAKADRDHQNCLATCPPSGKHIEYNEDEPVSQEVIDQLQQRYTPQEIGAMYHKLYNRKVV